MTLTTTTGTKTGDEVKITAYVGCQERIVGKLARYAIYDFCIDTDTGSIVLFDVDGKVHGKCRRAHFFLPQRQCSVDDQRYRVDSTSISRRSQTRHPTV